jgi:hypothetical protein
MKDEALKLALEALGQLWLFGDEAAVIANPAITAIKQALAAPVQEPFSPEAISATQKAWQMGYEAAKAEMQPEQKPVAWLHPANATYVTTDPTAYARGIPLYTNQPAAPMTEFEEAVAAVDNTLHHAIDHWQDRALKAEALLAQPEQEPYGWVQPNPSFNSGIFNLGSACPSGWVGSAIDVYTTPPAVAQREPVAEVLLKKTGGNVGIATVIHEIYSHYREPLRPGDKLYTTPPAAQRTWVGLTDAELADMHATLMVKLRGCYETKDLYRAIEQRLKDKNT